MGAGPLPGLSVPAHARVPARELDERARAAALGAYGESRGRLDELAAWLAACTGNPRPGVRARVVVAAADHGVAPGASDATSRRVGAIVHGDAAVVAMAREVGASVEVLDAGLCTGVAGVEGVGLTPSDDLSRAPALGVGAVAAAVDYGRAAAALAAADGITVLAGGHAGEGARVAVDCLAAWVTGRPADEGAAQRALELHGAAIRGPLGALRRLGGGDVALLCGLALGAGEQGLAYVCDGVVATAAAAIAVAIQPELRPRLLAGDRPADEAHAALVAWIGLEPVLDLGLTAGDGSGAVAALAVLRLACAGAG